jgi:hypothetical protein
MKIKNIVTVLIVAVILTSCASQNSVSSEPTLDWAGASGLPDRSAYDYDGITFAGKVVNQNTGAWENDRLVLLFYKSKEIARAVTSTGEYRGVSQGIRIDNNLGIFDGLFVIHIPNTYELSTNNFDLSATSFVQASEGSYIYLMSWVDPFYEGDIREYYIAQKNIRYTLMVLPDAISQLPAEIQQPGSVALLEGNRLVAVDPNAPEPTPQSAFPNEHAQFEQVTEQIIEFPAAIFPLNNCGGGAEIKQEITQTYIHEIIDESNIKFGIELPLTNWLKILFEVESIMVFRIRKLQHIRQLWLYLEVKMLNIQLFANKHGKAALRQLTMALKFLLPIVF